MNRTVLISAVTLVLAVAGTAGFFLAQPHAPGSRANQLEEELLRTRGELTRLKEERDHLVTENKKLGEASLHPAQAAPGPASGTASAEPGKAPAAVVGATTMASTPRKIMVTPGMRDSLRKQQEVQVDMAYGRLFQKFGLSDEERQNLKLLLADRKTRQAEVSMKLMDGRLTDAERAALIAQGEDDVRQSDAVVREFLNNDDDFKAFKAWDDTHEEQMQLQVGDSLFDRAGVPLSEDQRQQLVNAMAAVRKASNRPEAANPRSINPQSLTPENIAAQLQSYDEDAEKVARQATAFLSPQQLQALKQMQQQLRTMTEAGMHMMATMAGAKK